MPLLDSDTTDAKMSTNITEEQEEFRPRSGSAGIRNLFRKKHKSGTSDQKLSNSVDPTQAQQGPANSKMKNFFSDILIRPRSKSDAAAMQPPHRKISDQTPSIPVPQVTKPGLALDRSRHYSSSEQDNFRTPPNTPTSTPMSNLLGGIPPKSPAIAEMFRHRAYSDSKAKDRMAARNAATKAAMARKVCEVDLSI